MSKCSLTSAVHLLDDPVEASGEFLNKLYSKDCEEYGTSIRD